MNKVAEVRVLLIHILETKGIKLKFIADKLGWNYKNLVSWKNNNRKYSLDKIKELEALLVRL
ncbi:hypothetical protein [Bacillus sp. AFS017336]|uniref:hypothetical protein n=1 Tax=Bacillus sp. AFS017336 TaxID=2033489 RepID=UPI000BF05CF3|nr:hypothetical protein [Bacillus sp. AFS017336]PEL13773.1 hypothetical protein CN601_03410 [Bacillus sp. AFS017336]